MFDCAKNRRDFCERAGTVNDIEPDKILRDDFFNRHDRAGTFVRHERRQAMFVGEFQIKRGIGQIAQDRAGRGILARAASVKKRIADNIAAHKDGVESIIHTGENVRVWNQESDKRKPARDTRLQFF